MISRSRLLRIASYRQPWFCLLVSVLWFTYIASCTSVEPSATVTIEVQVPSNPTIASVPTATPINDKGLTRYTLDFDEVFGSHVWDRPIDIAFLPDGESALVAEQVGRVYRAYVDGRSEPELVFSVAERVSRTSNEEGLLSLALDPHFEENGRVWMYYSVQQGIRRTRLSWFTVDEYLRDWSAEHEVYEILQPFKNHNGGEIVFDNDGLLYLGLGDGGSAADPQRNGQDLTNVLGTIVRFDVSQSDDDNPYAIPDTNPYLDDDGVPDEIWAYGLRNPWRMSFDPEGESIWIGDVGQSYREEINVVDVRTGAGSNFGWNRMEGTACFEPRSDCDRSGIVMPVDEFPPRSGHCSVVGGYVYRGDAIPELRGIYLYSDHCKGELRLFDPSGESSLGIAVGDISATADGYDSPAIASFGVDGDGEIYVLRFGGPILKLVAE